MRGFLFFLIPIIGFSQTPITDSNIHSATDLWDSDQAACIDTYGNISNWDTSAVTNMAEVFYGHYYFDDDISQWDTSNVTTMHSMFHNAHGFNQDLSQWNTSYVTTMENMFYNAHNFGGGQNLNSWNVSSVTNMENMFRGTMDSGDLGDLDNWNVSNVVTMKSMFQAAGNFSGDVTTWDVSNVTNMDSMFAGAYQFNQDIGNWNVSNVSSMQEMFQSTSLSTYNYDLLLIGWSELSLQSNVTFDVGNVTYCNGYNSREYIIDNYSWTITDAGYEGEDCSLSIGNNPEFSLTLYPNPTRDIVFIDGANTELKAIVYDMLGKEVMTEYILDKIDISCLVRGTYFINISDGETSLTRKIIKN